MSSYTTFAGANASSAWLSVLHIWNLNRAYLVSIVGVSPRSDIDFFKADEIGRVLSRTRAFYNEEIGDNEYYYKLNKYYHYITHASPQLTLLDDIPVDLKMRLTPEDQHSLEFLYNKRTQHQNQYQNQPERPVLELPPMVVFLMWLYPGDLGGEATKSLKKFLESNNALQDSLDALREEPIPGYRLAGSGSPLCLETHDRCR
ncbi:uncharacterized protein CTRU02_215600 [Colletotrichum truncatum]|uniref:Uncharacterized protein n=1 Tax=Colletotrichum truncatum TaxID=5467 RepID=A0ACC3YC53_COLTU|nr:uncharacterized protein CTRU02_05463 [Colletotrichum truncatum]KAF6793906.1 hypothetical protein CTRU02_05463 [Colletotrichum truncatum]